MNYSNNPYEKETSVVNRNKLYETVANRKKLYKTIQKYWFSDSLHG